MRVSDVSVSVETLSSIPAFQKLTPSTLDRLAGETTTFTLQPGEAFYRQGDAPAGLFALQAGWVKFYRKSKQKSQILAILMPGECFGAESLPSDTPSPCTAEAITPATALYVPPGSLRQLLAECPDLSVLLLALISARLRQLTTLVHDLAFRDVAARLAAVLLSLAEAEGEDTDEGLRVQRILSQQEIASMVGTAREVIYRTFKKFERDGLLRLTTTDIYILDPQRLAAIARQETR